MSKSLYHLALDSTVVFVLLALSRAMSKSVWSKSLRGNYSSYASVGYLGILCLVVALGNSPIDVDSTYRNPRQ